MFYKLVLALSFDGQRGKGQVTGRLKESFIFFLFDIKNNQKFYKNVAAFLCHSKKIGTTVLDKQKAT